MLVRLFCICIVTGAVSLVLAIPPRVAHPKRAAAPNFAAIDSYVEAEMRADRVPGVVVAIVHGNQIVHMRGFGDDGTGKPVTPQTAFLLGSMSKSFTALAVMQLVDQGRIDLDAPVQQYLPWFHVADADASTRITVRHLLNHTSGIPTTAPQATDTPRSIEAHVRALATVHLHHPPGTVHEYASPNYLVLGAIVEQVMGQSFADYAGNHILRPLDMRHSFTSQTMAMDSTMARGHRYWFGIPRPTVLPYESGRLPTAAFISSAEDMAHFLIMQLNGGQYNKQQLLSPASLEEMHRPAIHSEGFAYGMGWRISEIAGVPAVHHGGVVPHFRGKMVLLPETAWGVVVLTNVSSMLPVTATSHRMADNIAAALVGKPLPQARSFLTWMYVAITLVIVLLTWDQLKALFTMKQWRRALIQQSRWTILVRLGSEILMPLAVLIGLPQVLGVPFAEILRSMPDIGYWLIATSGLGLAVAAYKAMMIYHKYANA